MPKRRKLFFEALRGEARQVNCPSCGGMQTLRTEIAYQNGVQRGSGTSTSLGVGLIGGELGIGLMGGGGPTKSISDLARSLAPPIAPRKPWWLSSFVLALIVLFFGLPAIVGILTSIFFLQGWEIFMSSLCLIFCIGYIAIYRKKSAEFKIARKTQPDEYARWQHEWACLQCGHRWVPENLKIGV